MAEVGPLRERACVQVNSPPATRSSVSWSSCGASEASEATIPGAPWPDVLVKRMSRPQPVLVERALCVSDTPRAPPVHGNRPKGARSKAHGLDDRTAWGEAARNHLPRPPHPTSPFSSSRHRTSVTPCRIGSRRQRRRTTRGSELVARRRVRPVRGRAARRATHGHVLVVHSARGDRLRFLRRRATGRCSLLQQVRRVSASTVPSMRIRAAQLRSLLLRVRHRSAWERASRRWNRRAARAARRLRPLRRSRRLDRTRRATRPGGRP